MGTRRAITPEDIARIGELVHRPWGIKRIAEHLGRCHTTIRRIVRAHFPDRPPAINGRPRREGA